ncbi:hypothetical protein P3W45_000847 [Vairimorpha bombi]|jgi:hypothetical protein
MVDNKNVEYNVVDVFYLDYILYKIVESYKYNVLDKLKSKTDQLQDNTHEDTMFDKLICKSLISKLQVKYDQELLLKIVYVRILQLLIKYREDEKLCLYKINSYLQTVKDKYNYIEVRIFNNKKISDVIIWLDEVYEKFNVPYLYKMCMENVRNE